MALEVIVALALVVANGFFVATEFAVARLRLTEVIEMERAGRPGAKSARHAVEHIDAYLAACQPRMRGSPDRDPLAPVAP